ncbi:DUF3888 domain-containing protein [Halalkalibacter akibai]|uniref:DUF3888 domain-containing protein n=1 Tax=Halalkalibacter akibai (strain ATCC 43226 / DSM 21942 / CIP 109018 / JCM 9157 / 1139) TaxID=1236973 RepID=W4QWZ6_HALA3|nr:DUF3888 domain-containing protein [Halalkalibacter akibai]GAE36655.1 hypothetical protein JCM9157_3858 [Halalkalibacter akibai JCM 9157]
MKKIISSLLLSLIVLAPISFVSAEVDLSRKIKKEIYAAPEELLVDLLNPYVADVVHKEHGDDVIWGLERVKNITLMVDHTVSKSRRWYEVSLTVKINKPDVKGDYWELDTVTFVIDPKTYFGSSDVERKNLKDVTVEIKDYVHHHGTNDNR